LWSLTDFDGYNLTLRERKQMYWIVIEQIRVNTCKSMRQVVNTFMAAC